MPVCKKCGKPITWQLTPKGLFTPVDDYFTESINKETGEVQQVKLSHFATCPNANDFRRKRNE